MRDGVLVMQGTGNTLDQSFHTGKELIGTSPIFEVSPIAFNRVKEGIVRRQPDDFETVSKQAQSGECGFTLMVGGVVHDQDNFLSGVAHSHQVFQEVDKSGAIFLGRKLP